MTSPYDDPMNEPAVSIRQAHWPEEAAALRSVRTPVFVEEQRVPPDLEWDDHEATAIHLLAEAPDGEPIGAARLLSSGQIGRMAVLKSRRKAGVGTALLGAALEIARQKGLPTPFLNAQVSAIAFYRRMGFSETGEEFMEAGIAHRRMELQQNG